MVLESLINPWNAKKHPFRLFLVGLLFSSIAVLFSLWIFRSEASLVMVFLTVVVSVPLMFATIEREEEIDLKEKSEGGILKEHSKALTFLTFLFLGFVVGYTLWYIFLPPASVDGLFHVQTETINAINSRSTGMGFSESVGSFLDVFANNAKVMVFCIFFAFFFGAGAIFILAWNASVISAAVGSYFRDTLANYAGLLGLGKVAIYFHLFAVSFFRYMIHGVFEIVAYFIGGLAGGIISIGLINHGVNGDYFKKVMYDALILILIAIGFLVVGAFIEVWITPLIF